MRTACAGTSPYSARILCDTRRPSAAGGARLKAEDIELRAGAWHARLELACERRAGRSVLSGRRHEGLLVVQKPLYPEGVDEIVRFAEEQGLLAASR